MNAPELRRSLAHRQRHVDAFGIEPRLQRRSLENLAARRERGIDTILHAVDQRPFAFAPLGGQSAERLEQCSDRAVLAQRRDAYRFERGFVGSRGDIGEDFVFQLREIVHRSLRHERQIGIGRPAAGLCQHAMNLAAMVGLVIKHVGDEDPARLGHFAFDGD